MINIFIAIIFASCSTQLFFVSYKLNGLNRVILSVPKSIFEASIPFETNSDIIYFDKDKVIDTYESYLVDNISKYSSSYVITYFFYDSETNLESLTYLTCTGVEITFETEIMLLCSYSRTMYYEILETKNGQ